MKCFLEYVVFRGLSFSFISANRAETVVQPREGAKTASASLLAKLNRKFNSNLHSGQNLAKFRRRPFFGLHIISGKPLWGQAPSAKSWLRACAEV